MHQGLFRDHSVVSVYYALRNQLSSPYTAIKIKPSWVRNYHSRIQERVLRVGGGDWWWL